MISTQYFIFTLPVSVYLFTLFCSTMYDPPIGEIAEGTVGVGRRSGDRRRSPDHNAPIYGELLVL